jgi:hypothetical protein
MAVEIFLLRLLFLGKLRLSLWVLCVLGCFFGLGFDAFCGMRLYLGRIATLERVFAIQKIQSGKIRDKAKSEKLD